MKKASFNNIGRFEKSAFCSYFLDVIKEFYQDPKNQKEFEEWIEKRKQSEKGE